MGLLHEHFERKRQFEERNLPITLGIFYDVGRTLATLKGAYQPLVDFAVWNASRKLIGPSCVFSNDLNHGGSLIHRSGIDLSKMDVESIIPKERIYGEASSKQHAFNVAALQKLPAHEKKGFIIHSAHCLELVVDDSSPPKGVMHTDLVITWWNPHDEKVRRFLENKEYLDFEPL